MLKFIFVFLFSLNAAASLLPKDKIFFYTNYSYSTSNSLWLLGDERTDYRGTNLAGNEDDIAERVYHQVGVRAYYGLNNKTQLGAGIRYGQVKLYKGDILFAKKNDQRSQISEIFLESMFHLKKFKNSNLNWGIRYIHPGEKSIQEPVFLSFNDFTDYLELELSHHYKKNKIQLTSKAKYKKTLSDLGNNHYILEETLLYKAKTNFSYGLSLDWLDTDGGRDVADDEFNEETTKRGDIPAWNKKEHWIGAALIGVYVWKYKYQFDAYLHKKLQGRNTDAATTIGFGFGMMLD